MTVLSISSEHNLTNEQVDKVLSLFNWLEAKGIKSNRQKLDFNVCVVTEDKESNSLVDEYYRLFDEDDIINLYNYFGYFSVDKECKDYYLGTSYSIEDLKLVGVVRKIEGIRHFDVCDLGKSVVLHFEDSEELNGYSFVYSNVEDISQLMSKLNRKQLPTYY